MAEKVALLINTGSPNSYKEKDVKPYLREFLSDKYIIDIPYLLRKMVVEFFILPFRTKKSAHAYKTIWQKDGSPLINISKRMVHQLKNESRMPVYWAMRYGKPQMEETIQRIANENPNLSALLVVPMFPHYAMSTFGSVIDEAQRCIGKLKNPPVLMVKTPFFEDKDYLSILSNSIKDHFSAQKGHHLLFSYHGVPQRHIRKMGCTGVLNSKEQVCCTAKDASYKVCYHAQTHKQVEHLAKQNALEKESYSTSFQSRLGIDSWIKPYTEAHLTQLANKGVEHLTVICPAFVSDCLETIEEIGERGQAQFIAAGGKSFKLIPCLNDDVNWVKVVAHWLNKNDHYFSVAEPYRVI